MGRIYSQWLGMMWNSQMQALLEKWSTSSLCFGLVWFFSMYLKWCSAARSWSPYVLSCGCSQRGAKHVWARAVSHHRWLHLQAQSVDSLVGGWRVNMPVLTLGSYFCPGQFLCWMAMQAFQYWVIPEYILSRGLVVVRDNFPQVFTHTLLYSWDVWRG